MKILLLQLVKDIIKVLIVLTPIFGLAEIAHYFGIDQLKGIDMIYFKAPKDVLTLLLVTTIVIVRLIGAKMNVTSFLGALAIVIFNVVCSAFSVNNVQAFTLISGIRWSISLILIFLLVDIINKELLISISKLLVKLLILNLTLQILEMLMMPPFFGYNYWGGTGRLPGFFSQASASGIFSVLVLYFVQYFYEGNKFLIRVLGVLSIVLSQSTLGFILGMMVLVFPILYRSKYKLILTYIAVPFVLIIGLNINNLTGRGEGNSEESISIRVKIFTEMLNEGEFISSNFGKATNAAMNMKRQFGSVNNSFIADSMYTSAFVNYGGIFFILFLITITYYLSKAIIKKDDGFILIVVLFSLTSVSIITSEIYPGNLLFPILIAFYLTPKTIVYKKTKR